MATAQSEPLFGWRGICRILFTIVLVWAWLKLWPTMMLLATALLLAVTLDPAVEWLKKRRVPRSLGVGIVAAAIAGVIVLFFALIVPPLVEQIHAVAIHFGDLNVVAKKNLPPGVWKVIRPAFEGVFKPDAEALTDQALQAGQATFSVVITLVLGLVLTVYLLLDGRRVYGWLLAYVPRRHRPKVQETIDASSKVVFAYVAGQAITSAICSVYVFIVLSVLDVPAAMVLALLAGVCDVLPVVGVIISGVPAFLLGCTVSLSVGFAVVGLYLLYHAIENYLLVPRIYGRRLRLSTLAVILALIIGGELGGLAGAVLVLPLVAVLPIIEQIWLAGHLDDRVLEEHAALDQAAGEGGSAVETVLEGQK